MRLFYVLLWSCCAFAALTSSVNALEIAFVSSGEPSSLGRMDHLAREAQRRGHGAAVLVDARHTEACQQALNAPLCLPVRCEHNRTCDDTLASFYQHAQTALREINFVPSVVFAAAFPESAKAVSRSHSAPLVILSSDYSRDELGEHSSLGHRETLPTWGSSLIGTILSAARGFASNTRWTFFSDTLHELYATHHVVTQGVPGFSLLGSRCPNVHPVGFLRADLAIENESSEIDKVNWSASCFNRFIYANLYASSVSAASHLHKLLEKASAATNSCVLWHNSANVLPEFSAGELQGNARVSMTNEVLASPSFSYLNGRAPVAVLSNTFADVVHDAVFLGAPIVLVDAPQALCGRVTALNVGSCVVSSSPSSVASATVAVINSAKIKGGVRAVQQMGSAMGGAKKALDVVELVAKLGIENRDFFCDVAIFVSPYGYNAGVVLSAGFVLSVIVCLLSLLFAYCTSRRALKC